MLTRQSSAGRAICRASPLALTPAAAPFFSIGTKDSGTKLNSQSSSSIRAMSVGWVDHPCDAYSSNKGFFFVDDRFFSVGCYKTIECDDRKCVLTPDPAFCPAFCGGEFRAADYPEHYKAHQAAREKRQYDGIKRYVDRRDAQ
jgi:hypothetical protein